MTEAGHFSVSPVFLLFTAVLYFWDDTGMIAAAVPPILMHELGHIMSIWLFGGKIQKIYFRLSGISIDYSGAFSAEKEAVIIAAGPGLGILSAIGLSAAGIYLQSRFLLCASGIGVLLNTYNLLPALPLDGGRFMYLLFLHFFSPRSVQRIMNFSTGFIGGALIVCGMIAVLKWKRPALLLAGAAILWEWLQDSGCQHKKNSIK